MRACTDLNHLDQVDHSLPRLLLWWQHLHCQRLCYDGHYSGEITIVGSKDVRVVGLHKVCQESIHIWSLIHVLCDW